MLNFKKISEEIKSNERLQEDLLYKDLIYCDLIKDFYSEWKKKYISPVENRMYISGSYCLYLTIADEYKLDELEKKELYDMIKPGDFDLYFPDKDLLKLFMEFLDKDKYKLIYTNDSEDNRLYTVYTYKNILEPEKLNLQLIINEENSLLFNKSFFAEEIKGFIYINEYIEYNNRINFFDSHCFYKLKSDLENYNKIFLTLNDSFFTNAEDYLVDKGYHKVMKYLYQKKLFSITKNELYRLNQFYVEKCSSDYIAEKTEKQLIDMEANEQY